MISRPRRVSRSRRASLFSSSDQDGDAITRVQFFDDHRALGAADNSLANDDSGHFVLNGTSLSEGQILDVSAANLANLTFQTGSGTDLLWARVFDGHDWGNWQSFSVAAPVNTAPVVTITTPTASVAAGAAIQASTVFTASDADIGDQIVKYQFWDSSAAANSAHLTIDGAPQQPNAYIDVLAADLSDVSITAAAVPENDLMWVRAFDGTTWGDWHSFNVQTH